jgi:hypothetical protein
VRTDQVSGLFLALVGLAIGEETLRKLPVGTLTEPGPGYMPLALAVAIGGLGLLVAAWGGASPLLRAMRWGEAPHAAAILGSCAFAAFALERIGYRLTVIAVMVFLLGVVERKRPVPVLVVSLGVSLLSFLLFADFLQVNLPRGPFDF